MIAIQVLPMLHKYPPAASANRHNLLIRRPFAVPRSTNLYYRFVPPIISTFEILLFLSNLRFLPRFLYHRLINNNIREDEKKIPSIHFVPRRVIERSKVLLANRTQRFRRTTNYVCTIICKSFITPRAIFYIKRID